MKNLIHLFICIFFSVNTIAQSYNDGPIDLQVKLREVQGNFTPTDESLLGIGFAPDELSFKIWTKDNLNTYPYSYRYLLSQYSYYERNTKCILGRNHKLRTQ